MNDTRRQAGHQHKMEGLCAAVLRAATGDARLHFEGGRLYDDQRAVPVYAPHLRLDPGHDTLAAYRGVADSLALRRRYSDAALHAGLVPGEPVERLIFEWLEQLRVESLVPARFPGMRNNLEQHYRTWANAFLASGSTETSLGILLFALSQIVWSRLTSHALSDEISDLLEPTRAALAPTLGNAFAGIRRYRDDQSQFAKYALEIARDIARRVQAEYQDSPKTGKARPGALELDLDFEQDEIDGFASVPSAESAVFNAAHGQYRIFSTRYDQELYAPDLVRAQLLREYRDRLDRRIAQQGMNVGRLSRILRNILVRPRRDGWEFGQEEGVIDGRRLTQLVCSPSERRLFRRDQHVAATDSVVSFLIDCSGSMRSCIESIAIMVDILMRAMGQIGVDTEILGFTTSAWNGGRVRQDWLNVGAPAWPGRLNEVRHLVFKQADVTWRHARRPLAALLKADLFREGIDGEAVDWACRRLLEREARRRILVVLSDGCPMDGATNLANDDFYLDNHLKAVIAQNIRRNQIEIYGVGVGLDMSRYYPRSLAIDLSQGLDNKVFDEFAQLLRGHYWH